jgi:signal peptidase I
MTPSLRPTASFKRRFSFIMASCILLLLLSNATGPIGLVALVAIFPLWFYGRGEALSYADGLKVRQVKLNSWLSSTVARGEMPARFTLYLRPFFTSGSLRVPCWLPSAVERSIMGPIWDFELALSYAVSDRAPVLALGTHDPKSIGAAKLQTADETWFEAFQALAEAAESIFCVAFHRPATSQEVLYLLSRPHLLSKTVFVMPPAGWFAAFRPFAAFMPSARRKRDLWNLMREQALLLAPGWPRYRNGGAFLRVRPDGTIRTFGLGGASPSLLRRLSDLAAGRVEEGALGQVVEGVSNTIRTALAQVLIVNFSFKSWAWSLMWGYLLVMPMALASRVLLFQPYTIPSDAMEPSLYQGDYLIVTKWSYGYSRHSIVFSPPMFRGRIMFNAPRRGDIIVFKWPHDGNTDYIKRLIGVPGDRVQVRAGVVYVNDKPLAQRFMANETTIDHCYPPNLPEAQCPKERVAWLEESNPDGRRYIIQDHGSGMPADDTGVYVVPPHCYFVMGDNRDNSADSRFDPGLAPNDPKLGGCGWNPALDAAGGDLGVGFVPEENLVGKVQLVVVSWKRGAKLSKPWTWLNLHWDRFFKSLQ